MSRAVPEVPGGSVVIDEPQPEEFVLSVTVFGVGVYDVWPVWEVLSRVAAGVALEGRSVHLACSPVDGDEEDEDDSSGSGVVGPDTQ